MTNQSKANNDIELQKLAFDREKVDLERQKLKVERFKAWWSGISVFVPLLAVAATVALGVWGQSKKAENDFILKAAEIVMNTKGPQATAEKAVTLKKIFPNRLSQDFAKSFDPKELFPEKSVIPAKKKLLSLLAAKPEHAGKIIAFWQALFPDDLWIQAFEKGLSHKYYDNLEYSPNKVAFLTQEENATQLVSDWFNAVIRKDLNTLVSLSNPPFYFCDKIFGSEAKIRKQYRTLLSKEGEMEGKDRRMRLSTIQKFKKEVNDPELERVISQLLIGDNDIVVEVEFAPFPDKFTGGVMGFFIRRKDGILKLAGFSE